MQDNNPPDNMPIILYEDGENGLTFEFPIDATKETIWATQDQLASLFEKDARTISEHISNIYKEGELEREATPRNFRAVRDEGGRTVSREIVHYNYFNTPKI